MSDTYSGIDISGWQIGLTDGGILTRGGVRFAIAKISEGRGYADKAFDAHYAMCEDAGIPLGAYVYSHSTSADGGRAEAEYALKRLGGRTLKLPIFLDIEADILAAGKAALMASALAFGETVKAAGYSWGVYASRSPWQTVLDADAVRAAGGYIWCAAYNNTGPGIDCDIWQCSSSGRLSGYGGNLDMDVMYNTAMLDGGTEYKPKPEPESGPVYEVPAATHRADMAQLSYGVDGTQLDALRFILAAKGYDVSLHGVFEETFKAVVIQYQRDVGLAADGIVGKMTWAALLS
jgi:lysozyme